MGLAAQQQGIAAADALETVKIQHRRCQKPAILLGHLVVAGEPVVKSFSH